MQVACSGAAWIDEEQVGETTPVNAETLFGSACAPIHARHEYRRSADAAWRRSTCSRKSASPVTRISGHAWIEGEAVADRAS